jgi:hypothetical protein
MSIPVREIATAVLFNLEEMYARKHSDPEIIEAINTVLRYVNVALINRESNWIIKETTLKIKNGKAKLPSDFAKMKGITVTKDGETTEYSGEYRLVKDNIYIDDADTMDYYFTIPMVETMDDEIDLPYFLLELFVSFATGLINGSLGKSTIDQLISKELDSLMAASNYPVIERPYEFFC